MKLCGLMTLLLFTGYATFGQSRLSVQPSFRYGQVMGQSGDLKKQLYGFSVDVSKSTSGECYWQTAHKYPQAGLQFSVAGSSQAMLGKAFTLIPYLEFNIWKTSFGTLQIKHGTGLAYVTRRYHISSNPENKLLGTKLNAASMVDLGYQIKVSEKWDVKAGASIGHISNGNLVQPNGGLNSLSGYGTLIYYPQGRSQRLKVPQVVPELKRWRYRISAMVGFYDYDKEAEKFHTNNELSVLAFYQHGVRFRTGVGLEVSRLNVGTRPVPALYAEEEVLIGHLVTRYGLGWYLSHADESAALYEKVGIAWYPFPLKNQIAERFSIGTSIKAHAFRAAHVEISAGFTF